MQVVEWLLSQTRGWDGLDVLLFVILIFTAGYIVSQLIAAACARVVAYRIANDPRLLRRSGK